jgi:hypothetical protein
MGYRINGKYLPIDWPNGAPIAPPNAAPRAAPMLYLNP